MKLRFHEFDLPLRHAFTISRSSHRVQKTLVVELSEGGLAGYGEATVNPYYGFSVESMKGALEAVRSALDSRSIDDPAALWAELNPRLADNPFAQCALDEAAHDLWGKARGEPVYRLWGLAAERLPPTNYTIGIDAIDVMIAKMREFPDWPVYKIKLGTADDLEIVRALRRETDSPFRVDANCGWGVDETIRNAGELQTLGVEFIEQPLPADDWAGMKRAKAASPLPLVADESCQREADVDRCDGHFDGVNIKLVKCGGLTPARRMIDRARGLGMKVMVGCMTESTVGISSIAQLLPLLDYVDMDGPLLLAQDIATGVSIKDGQAVYADENGCGVRLL